MNADYKSNISKICLFKFFISLHFFGGVMIPFFMEWGGITFTQIMILQSWFMFCVFFLEVPTGTIADYLGRKHSLILAGFVGILVPIIYTIKPDFYIFLLGEFLFALSIALMSGADQALIYDSLKKTNETSKSKKIFAKMESMGLAGIMIASPIGSIIAVYFGLKAPMLFMSIPAFAAFLIGLTLKEPKITTKKIESKKYLDVLKEGIGYFYNHKILKILAIDKIVIHSIAFMMIWLYQPMLMQVGVGIMYFGIINSIMLLVEITLMNNYVYFEKILGSKKKLIFMTSLLTGIMFIVGGISSYIPLILTAIILGGGFGLSRQPLFASYMNKHIPSSKRATVISSISMLERFALMILYPIVGLMVDWSLNNTLIILGIIAVVFSFISKIKEEYLID